MKRGRAGLQMFLSRPMSDNLLKNYTLKCRICKLLFSVRKGGAALSDQALDVCGECRERSGGQILPGRRCWVKLAWPSIQQARSSGMPSTSLIFNGMLRGIARAIPKLRDAPPDGVIML